MCTASHCEGQEPLVENSFVEQTTLLTVSCLLLWVVCSQEIRAYQEGLVMCQELEIWGAVIYYCYEPPESQNYR